MNAFQTIAILLTGAALAGYVNHCFFKLPTTIGLMVFALLLSLTGVGLNHIGLVDLSAVSAFVGTIDFTELLLHGLLSLLLFAGAMHIDLDELRNVRGAVALLASVGVVISAAVTALLVWTVANLLGYTLPFLYALLFGALIAPTDPIAVLSILKTTNISKRLYAKIGGESLFNDGVGVVMFLAVLGIATSTQKVDAGELAVSLVRQTLGGIVLGVSLGAMTYFLLRRIDEYKVEVLLTLALATGGYALAEGLELSAPIAMAAAGLVIGHHGRSGGMSLVTRHHLDLFWELLDEILNAVLFMLIGLQLMVMPMSHSLFFMGAVAVVAVLVGRFVSVGIPIGLIRFVQPVSRGTIRILTWGGLRGGISIAMALSLPSGAEKDTILAMTYIVVVFSLLVQGLTFRAVVRRVLGAKAR